MQLNLSQLRGVALACSGLALFAAGLALTAIAPLPRPVLGARGLMRAQALKRSHLFELVEPATRWLAALVTKLPLAGPRARLELALLRAGDFMGLCADEFFALSLLLTLLGTAAGLWARSALEAPAFVPYLGAALGMFLPWSQVRAALKQRRIGIARALPPAIDLLALCVGAGLDLTRALELLVRELQTAHNPVAPELARVLQELALGRTRREALSDLAARVPAPAMTDFAHALIQAELKGTPLADAVEIKARMLRMHRSVAAEEAAARASVLLVLPMLLLLASLMIVMLGPFLISGMGF